MISEFKGEYRFLSNFWPAVVELDGVEYPTVEHAYQAAKCKHRSDRDWINRAPTPGEAKRRARQVDIRRDWDEIKLRVMESLVRQKFAKDPLKQRLLDTGEQELVEGNTWGDTFWGVSYGGKGSNWLGRILMDVRAELLGLAS